MTAGAHPAEVGPTDGAGKRRDQEMDVNVDPEGDVSTEEAEATAEALEETSGSRC